MMTNKVTPEEAIRFTKLMVKITFCWPLPLTASRAQTIGFKVVRFLLILSGYLLFFPMVNAIYTFRNDPLSMLKSVCLTCATIQIVVQTTVFVRHYKTLQMLVIEVEEFLRTAPPWKMEVLQKYTDKCAIFYTVIMVWFYFNATFILLGPLLLTGDEFPMNAVYPFPIESMALRVVLYLHQSFVLLQCAGQVCLNAFIALLLWFAATRFEILSMEMRNVREIGELRALIRIHQNLMRYTDSIVESVRYVALTSVLACFISLVFNGLTLLIPTSPESKIQFGILNTTALIEVFMLSWPANHLMDVYAGIADGLYESKWYEASLDVRKTIIFITMRARKPAVISVSCIMPPLSLRYFGSFAWAALRYFTTLRILVENN